MDDVAGRVEVEDGVKVPLGHAGWHGDVGGGAAGQETAPGVGEQAGAHEREEPSDAERAGDRARTFGPEPDQAGVATGEEGHRRGGIAAVAHGVDRVLGDPAPGQRTLDELAVRFLEHVQPEALSAGERRQSDLGVGDEGDADRLPVREFDVKRAVGLAPDEPADVLRVAMDQRPSVARK